MLGKLLKYEFKATARLLLPMYLAVVLFSIINRIFFLFPIASFENPILSGLFSTIRTVFISGLVLLIIATFLVTFIMALRRYYTNLLGDEGYLMHTLPVKPYQHILSKLLIAMLWNLISFLVVMLSLFILLATPDRLSDVYQHFAEICSVIYVNLFAATNITLSTLNIVLFCIEGVIFFLFFCLGNFLLMYASMSFGHLFPRRRVLYSVAGYLLFNFLLQLITGIVIFIASSILGSESLHLMYYFENHILLFLHLCLWSVILYNAVVNAAYYFISLYVMKKRLNLQ